MNRGSDTLRQPFLDAVGGLLGDSRIVVIDGGARNKTWELQNLASFCDVLSFEPNRAEFEKIQTSTTDLERLCRLADPPYHSIRYLPAALAGANGPATLHITEGPGACSLLEPNQELIAGLEYFHPYDKPFGLQFRVVDRETVDCLTLDDIARSEDLQRIDYLKLDTQGNELQCLEGAARLLDGRRIGVIKTEVGFLELYKGQAMFADIDRFLRARGFMLLDLSFWSEHKVLWGGTRLKGDRGTLLFADAYYALSPDEHTRLSPGEGVRHGLVCAEIGFLDFGLALIRAARNVDAMTISRLLAWWQRDTRSWKTRLKDRIKTALRVAGRLLGN